MFWCLVLACGVNSAENGDSGDGNGSDTGFSTEVQAYLEQSEVALEGYEDWDQLDDWTGIQPGESVHGDYVEIWLNSEAFETIQDQTSADMPVGALLAKQGWDEADGTSARNFTVMYKVDADYGWFWASWSSDGEVLMAGQPDACTGCHSAGQDSVLFTTW